MEYHVLSLGAGIQSTVLFLMIRHGELKLPEPVAVFADTQEEPQAVYAHLNWLMALEYPRILVRTAGKLGDDLINGHNSTGGRFAAIPAFTQDGSPARRQCTHEYKTEVIQRTIRREVVGLAPGRALPRTVQVHLYVGISRDEAHRSLGVKKNIECKRGWFTHFPLLEMNLTRADCMRWLQGKVPHRVPRSACVFCPYKTDREWLELKRGDPEGWARAVAVDAALKDMRLHRSYKPLPEVNLNEAQYSLGFAAACDGLCGN